MINDWLWVLFPVLTFLIGFLVGRFFKRAHEASDISTPAGVFYINYDDPTKELMYMKLNIGLPEIEESDYILLKVDVQGSWDSDPKNSPGENL